MADAEIAGVDDPEMTGVAADMDTDSDDEEDLMAEMDRKYGPWSHNHDLWPPNPCAYSHLHGDLEHTALTQYNVKKWLKIFGEAGAQAVITEMQQLHDHDVIVPKHASMLTQEEKRCSLQYLMFLKQKRCGCIKGRGCADGWKQRVYKTKEETSAPTVSIESLFLLCVIDAKEGQKVATCDIQGAFMQADIDEITHVKLKGPLATFLTKVDPEKYTKYIMIENGKEVMYVWLVKALYSTMQAALLFWKDLTGYLIKQGFELNPYDECVVNKQADQWIPMYSPMAHRWHENFPHQW